MSKSLSQRLFDQTVTAAEDELIDFIWDVCGSENFADWQWDWYDLSLELVGCQKDFRLPKEVLSYLFDQGFARVWLQHSDNMQTYYTSLGDDGSRSKLAPYRVERNEQLTKESSRIVELRTENNRLKRIIKDIG